MKQWLNVQTLIWLFPIAFVLHDLEELLWLKGGCIRTACYL